MVSTHEIELYASAAVVFGAGRTLLTALSGTRREEQSPVQILSTIWSRKPWASAVVLATMLVMICLQYTVHGLSGHLTRQPGALHDGQWWRVLTALSIQSSGLVQIIVNLPALAVAGPIAERVFGPVRWLLIFLGSGVVANIASEEGWGLHGGGCSIAICGLVGALAATCLLRANEIAPAAGEDPNRIRQLSLAIAAAGAFLCVIKNNHGAGLLTGCALGLIIAAAWPASLRLSSAPRTPDRPPTSTASPVR